MTSIFRSNGIRDTNVQLSKTTILDLKRKWKRFIDKDIKSFPNDCKGRGIVMCAGGLRYLTCGWISIKILRQYGCTLPIEVWYLGNELSQEIIEELKNLNVTCRDFLESGGTNLSGYMLKPLAILKSKFEEVLFLDADNVCTKDPSELFFSKDYLNYGAVFWPDYWKTSKANPIWQIISRKFVDMPEQESGQILINKRKCWLQLNLCVHFNTLSKHYYQIVHGDKDTFKFAWLALNTPFFMIQKEVGACGYMGDTDNFLGITMVQHNPIDGEPLFLHRNLLKWDVTHPKERAWQKIKKFRPQAVDKEYIIDYSENGHFYMDLCGDIEEYLFTELFGDFELVCMNFLNTFRNSKLYQRYVSHMHYATFRYNRS